MEVDCPLGLAPAVRRLAVQPPIAAAAKLHRVLFHHLGQGCDPSRQAEALEARANCLPGIGYQRRRIGGLRCAILLHGIAFLRGFDTPNLPAQGGQRRPTYFNISRDIPSCILSVRWYANGLVGKFPQCRSCGSLLER